MREELAVQPVVDERTPGRVAALLLLESFRRVLERKLVTCACSVSPCAVVRCVRVVCAVRTAEKAGDVVRAELHPRRARREVEQERREAQSHERVPHVEERARAGEVAPQRDLNARDVVDGRQEAHAHEPLAVVRHRGRQGVDVEVDRVAAEHDVGLGGEVAVEMLHHVLLHP